MTTQTIITLAIIGLITGALGGMMGIGGGLIMIPALIFFFGFTQHQAVATSLAVMLPPVGLFAVYNFYKAGHVNIGYAAIIAAMFIIGSYVSSKFALKIPSDVLKKVFSVFLFLVAIKMFFSK